MQEISPNRFAAKRYVVAATVFALLGPVVAYADSPACSATDTSLSCRLVGLLHWLEAAAFVLGLVLIAVIGVAIHLFRKNRLSRKAGR
ncbi:MAG TPA: hypothetical protein VGU25_08090 [Acidobacteriaceae bacterium]|nr:hypothetical protein [Acidobacteriaceae bacterium]